MRLYPLYTKTVLLIALAAVCSCGADLQPTVKNTIQPLAQKVGELQDPALEEASGMAFSNLRNDLLWVVNDSGDNALLYAVGTDGTARGRVRLGNADNIDWEDLAAFQSGQTAYLVVADVGDNRGRRPHVTLYIIEEPLAPEHGRRFAADAQVDWQQKIQVSYEDGPRDCEAVAVDSATRTILLLTKRDRPPVLYHLPLALNATAPTVVARRLVAVETIPAPTLADIRRDPRFGRLSAQPTALDVSPDGTMAVVQTYKHAYLFRKAADGNWAEAFAAPPERLTGPRLPQAEATCFGPDAHTIYMTSEKRPAPLYRISIEKGASL